jgi:hypothetical protein
LNRAKCSKKESPREQVQQQKLAEIKAKRRKTLPPAEVKTYYDQEVKLAKDLKEPTD